MPTTEHGLNALAQSLYQCPVGVRKHGTKNSHMFHTILQPPIINAHLCRGVKLFDRRVRIFFRRRPIAPIAHNV